MTTVLTPRSIGRPGLQLPPVVLAAALAVSFIAGAAAGPLVSLVGSTTSPVAPLVFDDVAFRAGERQSLFFDAVRFRCEETERC